MAGNRLTADEVESRVLQCYELRFNSNDGLGIKKWLQYCHENYNDKSEQQYTDYWMKAGERYKEGWRELLNKQLTPAVLTIIELLGSEDEKVRQRAVDQIMKYTGNDIEKVEANVSLTQVKTNWGATDGTDS